MMRRSRSRSTSTSSTRSPSHSPSRSFSRSRSPTAYSPASPPCDPDVTHYRRGGSGEGGAARGDGEERGTRVHVGSLSISTSTRELQRQFRRFGDIQDLWMARTHPCFAFVVFRHKEDALRAIRFMDGETVHNRRIRVTMARPRTKGTRSGGTFNPYLRCYQCGKMGHFSRVCRAHQWTPPARPDAARSRRGIKERQDPRDYSKSHKAARHSSSGGATYQKF